MRNFDKRAKMDAEDEARRVGASTPEQYAEAGFLDVHQSFDRMMLNEARSDSESRLMEDDVNSAIDAYSEVNPDFKLDYRMRRYSRGFRFGQRRDMLKKAEAGILEAQQKFPDAGLKTHSELLAGVQEKTKTDRELAMRTFANARGMARAGMLTGSMTGVITDPLILATLPMGAGTITGGSILGNAARAFKIEALIAGGSELAIQPQVYNWKKDINSPYSVQEAAFNVMTAMVAAGAIRATGSSIVDVVQIRSAAKLKRAEGSKLSDTEADILDQYADDIEAGGPEKEKHFDNLDQALDDFDRGETSAATKRPEHVEEINPLDIGVDADQFQFKAGTDAEGVSERLQGVARWDPKMAGISIVYEQADGARFIVDGHQRVALAKRMIAGGQDPGEVKLNSIVLRESDGVSVSDARQIAAVKNVAEGTGSAVDTAKVFRELGDSGLDLMPSLPPKSALVVAGRGLSNLDDEAFKMVINGVIDEKYGAIVGELIKDAAEQRAVITALSKAEPANLNQARIMINDMKAAGFQRTETEDLFGGQEIAESLFKERARILDNSLKSLRQDKKTFKTLTDRAEDITGAGNKLNREANLARMQTDEQTLAELTRLANRKGPISDALNKAASDLKEGQAVGKTTKDFLDAVRRGEPEQRSPGPGAGGSGSTGEAVNLVAEKGKPIRLQEITDEDLFKKTELAFRDGQISKTLDEIYAVAEKHQKTLVRIGNKLTKDIGKEKIAFISPPGKGIKDRAKAESRMVTKHKKSGEMTDIVRGGFMVRDVEDTERIVMELSAKYKVLDEGINTVDMGYTDRKIMIQFDDGIVAEVQVWEPHMLAAKEGQMVYNIIPKRLHKTWIDPDQVIPAEGKAGHNFYDDAMEFVENRKVQPENQAAYDAVLKQAQDEVYFPAIRSANLSWKTLIETRRPELDISGGAAATQSPGSLSSGITKPDIDPSASSTTTAGRISQSYQARTSESLKGFPIQKSIAESDINVKTAKTVSKMTPEELKAEIFEIDAVAKAKMDAWAETHEMEARIATGDLQDDFMTLEGRDRMHELKQALPGTGEEVAAAKARIQERIAARNAKKEPVLDMFGEDTRGAQAMHDARLAVDKELNPDNIVPVEAGPGDLFSGKSRQIDLEDEVDRLIYERDLDIPEGVMVDQDGKIVAKARSAKEVYNEIDNSAKVLDEIEGCYIGQA